MITQCCKDSDRIKISIKLKRQNLNLRYNHNIQAIKLTKKINGGLVMEAMLVRNNNKNIKLRKVDTLKL